MGGESDSGVNFGLGPLRDLVVDDQEVIKVILETKNSHGGPKIIIRGNLWLPSLILASVLASDSSWIWRWMIGHHQSHLAYRFHINVQFTLVYCTIVYSSLAWIQGSEKRARAERAQESSSSGGS